MVLTQDTLLAALYCTSPTGIVQLMEHLCWRFPKVIVEIPDLVRLLNQLIADQIVARRHLRISNSFDVDLFTLKGYGI